MEKQTSKLTTYSAAAALLLLVLFVLIIPIVMDLRQMPVGKAAQPNRPVAISSWPMWPDRLEDLGVHHPPAALENLFGQISHFANQSAYPVFGVERTIEDVKAGRASENDLYETSRAAEKAAEDERDALMGLVILPEVRANPQIASAWHNAQLAAIAKVEAMQALQLSSKDSPAWTSPRFLQEVQVARDRTMDALNAASQAAQG